MGAGGGSGSVHNYMSKNIPQIPQTCLPAGRFSQIISANNRLVGLGHLPKQLMITNVPQITQNCLAAVRFAKIYLCID